MSSSRSTPPDAADRPKRRIVIFRDLIFFQIKLWLDGLKDVVLSPLSIVGAGIDILFGISGEASWFYRVMRLGERFDLWLNLYGPAKNAARDPDGLLNRRGIRGGDMIRHVDAIHSPPIDARRGKPSPNPLPDGPSSSRPADSRDGGPPPSSPHPASS